MLFIGICGASGSGKSTLAEELATMVWRFAKTQGVDVSNPDPAKFNATVDHASVSSFAVEPLKWTAAAGIMGGVDYGNGQFGLEPQGTAMRVQAAKVFSVLVRDILSGKVQVPTVGKCTITFNTNGGSAVKSQMVKPGGKVTKPANPTKTGHTFKAGTLTRGARLLLTSIRRSSPISRCMPSGRSCRRCIACCTPMVFCLSSVALILITRMEK